MKKQLNFLTVALLGITSLLVSYAQETDGKPMVRPVARPVPTLLREEARPASSTREAAIENSKNVRMEARADIKGAIDQKKEEVMNLRDDMKMGIDEIAKQKRDDVRAVLESTSTTPGEKQEAVKKLRADYMAEIEQKRTEFKSQLEERKTEMKSTIEAKRADLKTKLASIKDERKQNLALSVNDKFQALNKKAVETLSNTVTRQEAVLQKIKERVAILSGEGVDVTVLNSQIGDIDAKIADVRSAILSQSEKVYTIDVTTEDELKTNTEATRNSLRTDITALHDAVTSISTLIKNIVSSLNTNQ